MPWKETCPMDEKIKFIALVKSDVYSFAEACRRFGISRKSGYVLVERYEREGAGGHAIAAWALRDEIAARLMQPVEHEQRLELLEPAGHGAAHGRNYCRGQRGPDSRRTAVVQRDRHHGIPRP